MPAGGGSWPGLCPPAHLSPLLPEHCNYFGVDEKLGPVAVSIRRERLEDHREHGPQYQYRMIFRTSEVGGAGRAALAVASQFSQPGGAQRPEDGPSRSSFALQLTTLRGSILEDATPTATKHGTVRGLPLKDLLEHVVPELNTHCLRLALSLPRVTEQLRKLDEQGVSGWRCEGGGTQKGGLAGWSLRGAVLAGGGVGGWRAAGGSDWEQPGFVLDESGEAVLPFRTSSRPLRGAAQPGTCPLLPPRSSAASTRWASCTARPARARRRRCTTTRRQGLPWRSSWHCSARGSACGASATTLPSWTPRVGPCGGWR